MGDGIEEFQHLRLNSTAGGFGFCEAQLGHTHQHLMESSEGQGHEDWVDFEAEFGESTQTHSKRFAYYLESGTESDVVFHVGRDRKAVKAHKLILSIGSPVFRALFNEDGNKHEFDIPDIEPEDFELFLKFLYTGEPPTNVADALPLLNAANKHKIPDLTLRCGVLMKTTLTNESAIVLFQQACKFNNVYLQKAAMGHICRNAAKIVESQQFLELTTENLIKVLEKDKLEVLDESQLFDAVMRWAKERCKSEKVLTTPKYLRSMLDDVIHLIRFPQMNSTEFSLKVAPAQVLTTDEVVSVLLYFQVPETLRNTIPAGVFNSKPRKYYVPRGEFHVVRRLDIGSDPYYGWPMTANSSTYYYIPMTHASHSVKFKVCSPVWITSFGLNPPAISQVTSDNDIQVKIKLFDSQEQKVIGKREFNLTSANSIVEVQHLEFEKPIRVRADVWYIASFRILEGNYFGKVFRTPSTGTVTEDVLFKTVTDNFVCKGGKGVTFEFENADACASYTTTLQGYLPEIGFQVE